MRTLAVLQARVSSSRLAGKVLLPLLGVPMLMRQVERIQRAGTIDRLVVATSVDPSDDPVSQLCVRHGVECFRGSLNDVLDRYVQAARPYAPDTVVRLTGDCPLTDPAVIDRVIEFFYAGDYDYASNTISPTFPDGLDVEVMRFRCLEQAAREAVLPSHREHVTPFLRAYPDRFRIGSVSNDIDRSQLRWTVDEPEDFEFVTRVYERLHPGNARFATDDILDLLERDPALQALNSRFARNEGTKKSLQADAEFLAKQP